jgi:hypothetical protein
VCSFLKRRIFAAGAHSLRVGLLASVARRGASVFKSTICVNEWLHSFAIYRRMNLVDR